jgi:hypothetical protein
MFRQYTQCYNHTPPDKPFNIDDLAGFVLGASAPGLVGFIISMLTGNFGLGAIFMGVQFAATIIAVANEWLFHRLVCVSPDPLCAVGIVKEDPAISDFGEFDNDEFFDLRLMPHRANDEYKSAAPASGPGPSQDGKTELVPENDIYNDNFQGTLTLKPSITTLPYDRSRSALHCEAEGAFWQDMKDYAPLLGVGVAAGAAAGAAAGCAIGGIFGIIGCIIGAILGAIFGGANAVFNSNPGNVEDANVGDRALGPIQVGDKVAVLGKHVYDGFHEGWHEFHPLMAVVKMNSQEADQYLEWNPDFTGTAPAGLTAADMKKGLASKPFRARAVELRARWCGLLQEAFDPGVKHTQEQDPHRWTAHPEVDGCEPREQPPVPR